MAKILCIGDLHITNANLGETRLLIDRIEETILRTQPDQVIFMGDTLDRFGVYTADPYAMADDAIREVAALAPLIVLIGNHDIPNRNDFLTTKHPFRGHKDVTGVKIVDDCCHIFEIKGLQFAAIPYVPKGRLEEALRSHPDFDLSKIQAIFGHQEVRGSKIRADISSLDGDIYHVDYPPFISGHIHAYHRSQDNVIYIGTPRQVAFDEIEEKTISLFTFGFDLTADSQEVKPKFKEERINLGIPPHLEIRVAATEIADWSPPEHGIIKVIIYGTYSANRAARSHPKILDWKRRKIVVVYEDQPEHGMFDIVEAGPSGSYQPLAYQTLLLLRFQQQPRQLELFNRLFAK